LKKATRASFPFPTGKGTPVLLSLAKQPVPYGKGRGLFPMGTPGKAEPPLALQAKREKKDKRK